MVVPADPEPYPIDHVVLGVRDLRAAAARLWIRHHLRAIEGVRFESWPGWGNWLVPLGDSYIEMLGVADREAAEPDPEEFLELVGEDGRWLGWALAVDDIDAAARRRGLEPQRQAMAYPDGQRFEWSLAGWEERFNEPYLPFFLRWDEPAEHALRIRVMTEGTENQGLEPRLSRVELSGDPDRLDEWLAELNPAYALASGWPGMTAAVIETNKGEIRLEA